MRFRVDASKVAHESMQGETLIIDLETGAYFSTEQMGSEIWELVSAEMPEVQICRRLAQRHGHDPALLGPAVRGFLEELRSAGLVVAVDPGADEAETPSPATALPFDPPRLCKYTDMQDLLLLDPIHEVGDDGWPTRQT